MVGGWVLESDLGLQSCGWVMSVMDTDTTTGCKGFPPLS